MAEEKFRQNNFDFLRFFFAFIVVIGHLIELSKVPNIQFLQPYFNAYVSVTGFFCISGFLITRSYINTSSLSKFFSKRAGRLLPAYIFVVFASALLLHFVSVLPAKDYFSNTQLYKYLLANLSFLNFIEPCLPGVFISDGYHCAVNGALWTLKIEVSFYLIVPLFLYFVEKTNRKFAVLFIVYLLAVLYRNGLNHLAETTGNVNYLFISRQLPGFMSYFVSGIALHYFYEILIKHKTTVFLIGLVLFSIDKFIPFEIFAPIGLSFMIFTFAYSLKKLNNFGKYGDISFGIYIFHFPLIQLAVHLNLFEKYNPILVGILTITVVLAAGFASWHLLEKRWIIKFSTRGRL